MKKAIPTLYLFNNIFYPQTVIPLTVSDQVSKEMVLNCFENNTTIALYHPGKRSKNVATLGKILLIDLNEDQSLSVVVQGLVRIKLLSMQSQDPYPRYLVDDYQDSHESTQTLHNSPIERLRGVLERWIHRHVNSERERELFLKDISSPTKLVNNLCMLIIKDIELKQIFLESTSLLDRVQMMNSLLVGESPENENLEICEAIKKFERNEAFEFESRNAS